MHISIYTLLRICQIIPRGERKGGGGGGGVGGWGGGDTSGKINGFRRY